ncbi:MAG: tetratricopeptide repeat protein [Candidatus Acidiferrales bacterium]
MSQATRFAVPLAIVVLLLSSAIVSKAESGDAKTNVHHSSAKAASEQSNSASPTDPAKMTPRQLAELKADILMARKEYSQAIDSYDKLLQSEPKNAALLNKVGVAYQEMDDLIRAERFYKKSMHVDKHFASPVNNYGTVEYTRKRFGKAIGAYKKALVLTPDAATIYGNLGYAYFANKEYPRAMDSFESALKIDPSIFDRKGGYGAIIQQRSSTDPGLFYYFVAKSFAQTGDAIHAAHYLKLARDEGYADFVNAQTDPAFAKVIKDPGVQEVFQVQPAFMTTASKQFHN